MTFPILIPSEQFRGDKCAIAICQRCLREATWDPSEGDPYDLCARCPATDENRPGRVCGGPIVFKYVPGDSCKSCGKLDHEMPRGLGGCCSRRCQLQAEYAESLRNSGASTPAEESQRA